VSAFPLPMTPTRPPSGTANMLSLYTLVKKLQGEQEESV
jgi:hypothetical protein